MTTHVRCGTLFTGDIPDRRRNLGHRCVEATELPISLSPIGARMVSKLIGTCEGE
jgi:hypothetical protein